MTSPDNPSNPQDPHDSTAPTSTSTTDKQRRPLWQRIARTFAIVYGVACGGLMLMENQLVFPGAYFPATKHSDSAFLPHQRIPHGKVVTLQYPAIDETPIRGRLLIHQNPQRTILFLHGNASHAVDLDQTTRQLSRTLDATVMTAEYRGYQGNGFRPSEESIFDDAESAIEALAAATQTPISQVTVYGRSLGGGVAAGLVDRLQQRGQSVRSLVLDRTFDSAAGVGQDRYFILPVRWLMRNQFDSVQHLQNYRGPVVQIHGSADRIVPKRNGLKLFDRLPTDTKLWIEIANMHHNDSMSDKPLNVVRMALSDWERLGSQPALPASDPAANTTSENGNRNE